MRLLDKMLGLLPESTKFTMDALSVSALLGAVINLLPSLATLLTIVWTGIRIYETATVQRLISLLRGEKEA